jgi:hypothetical protein
VFTDARSQSTEQPCNGAKRSTTKAGLLLQSARVIGRPAMIASRPPEDEGEREAILDHAEGWRHCGQMRPVGFGVFTMWRILLR